MSSDQGLVDFEMSSNADSIIIREVWRDNLEDEFKVIRDIVDTYHYVAMDTEFPGVVFEPPENSSDHNYQKMKANVDKMKLIQLGLTFSDEKGNLAPCGNGKSCIWQFNFREFNRNDDFRFSKSIDLLINSGIDFEKNMEKGVDIKRFGELLMSSGAVLNDEITWVTFHCQYDFGYLVKLLTGKALPDSRAEFLDRVKVYFPVLYDIKHVMKFCNGLYGGLNNIARQLGVERVGVSHQAGSDSLVTSRTFTKLRDSILQGSIEMYAGVLFGLEPIDKNT